jgi:NAD(P)-dependent dehydrogenase (short-subunit alcohol dehydrogenase family)
MLASMWRQGSRSLVCPEAPRLDGQRALVTGGSEGVGFGTCRGLLQRGSRVVMASRSAARGERACGHLRGELGADAPVSYLPLDLSDLSRVREAVRTLATQLGQQRLDVLICNAGLWPRRHDVSPQGHELAFATNVLGHFLLLRHLVGRQLAADARVVIVSGDIYVLASDCTPDYRYRTPFGGMLAYCRSKLGNLWLARELQRRHPELHVRVAHPGVVATNLGGERRGLANAVSRRMLLDVVRGAQTPLYCATQPGLPDGAYIHNVLGIMKLSDDDPASDGARAARLWDRCETLCRDYLSD